mmetsp:Transcript_11204/g.18846  ORF Transcript_11204/g.18846 Transcript_11204/m.18846 type:complete len:201 (-) Transcript_11204:181-783(-)
MTKQSWRICIQSYARHHPDFAKDHEPIRVFTSKIARKVQYRAIKTACHELAHVLSIRHCQAYECLMNGSSALDEADMKPFALCPVCLRKMSSYLFFNGQELQMLTELRDVFKLMNHNDTQHSFRKEIRLLDRVISQLSDVYIKGEMMDAPSKEGGNTEKDNCLNQNLIKPMSSFTNKFDLESQRDHSETFSDKAYKQMDK